MPNSDLRSAASTEKMRKMSRMPLKMEKRPKVTKRVVMNSALVAAAASWSAFTVLIKRSPVRGESWAMASSVSSAPVSRSPRLEVSTAVTCPSCPKNACAWANDQITAGPLPANSPSGTTAATVNAVGIPLTSSNSSPGLMGDDDKGLPIFLIQAAH